MRLLSKLVYIFNSFLYMSSDAREEKSAFPPFKGFMKHSIPICLMVALLKYTLKPSATLAHAENLVPISLLLIGLCTYWAIDGIMKMKNADKSAYFPILNRVVIGSVAISGLSILSLILSIFLQWQVFIIPLLLCWVIFVASVWPLIRYIYRHLRLRIMITHNYFSIKIKNMVTKVSTTQSLTHEMQNPTPMSVVVA